MAFPRSLCAADLSVTQRSDYNIGPESELIISSRPSLFPPELDWLNSNTNSNHFHGNHRKLLPSRTWHKQRGGSSQTGPPWTSSAAKSKREERKKSLETPKGNRSRHVVNSVLHNALLRPAKSSCLHHMPPSRRRNCATCHWLFLNERPGHFGRRDQACGSQVAQGFAV